MTKSPYEFQKETTVVLTQKIGHLKWEVEARASEEKLELTARDEFGGRYELMTDLSALELRELSEFLLKAQTEAIKIMVSQS